MKITLGSLFDGAGTVPWAAVHSGITPLWSSEIEKFPLAVTAKRFPEVKQLGDITKIDGRKIEPVDIISFGSPCQDLSIANTNRSGLDGERSGLFMEAIRIIKEMRDESSRTNKRIRPRFAVWENVPGAFSSNKGEDFRIVLEEICKVTDSNASVPRPADGGWRTCGCIVGDGYSVAWRVLDAQFWGVPQRRRRIWLVADFRGGSAAEILFKREGLQRSFAESRSAWQRTAEDVKRGVGSAVAVGIDLYNQCFTGDKGKTLRGFGCEDHVPCVCFVQQTYSEYCKSDKANALRASFGNLGGGSETLMIGFSPQNTSGQGISAMIDKSPTLQTTKQNAVLHKKRVRRLTPTECARLQGMPDWWCADIPHSDSAEYKMWGNGMAFPCVLYVLEGIAEILKQESNYESS